MIAWSLNEGRGEIPGDSAAADGQPERRSERSTKAGERSPATVRVVDESRQPLDRSTKAGERSPATGVGAHRPGPHLDALNEGRGEIPGDRGKELGDVFRFHGRSTKAGERSPATAGDESGSLTTQSIAQRRPGRDPRRQQIRPDEPVENGGRSTKAGERSPATGPNAIVQLLAIKSAQRRPGRDPRRQPRCRDPARQRCIALNEGRGEIPGDSPNLEFGAASGALGPMRAAHEPGAGPHSVRIGPFLSCSEP